MVLDNKIEILQRKFDIRFAYDWQRVTPAEVLATPDVGEVTLNHLRLHLAAHGLTLKNDATPEFWQSKLYETKLGTLQVSKEDRSIVCPFTILVDSQEKHPFLFRGFTTDREKRPLVIPTLVQTLGPTHGDYSVAGLEGVCHIERKSIDDARGTILGWGDRREQFQRTLAFLSSIPFAAIVIECTFGELINSAESRGKKTIEENRKILHRQVLAWQTDFTVPWIFCDDRRFAERTTFRIIQRCWTKQIESQKLTQGKEHAKA
jgi:hypothetical protein